ncbi:hypothetical protein HDF10_001371 [Edaphobacter lichenicola]|uniref:Uncharacterized protein n=1 Tax=Tunturiibacter lichenicola TaxID=2051959 RepID=A0A7W8N4B2_9BACT|nr:hypothetical protein [Edaphobacter lichenicola]
MESIMLNQRWETLREFLCSSAPSTVHDPYCYPGTDVLINKLGIRDKHALEIAETEIGTLRTLRSSCPAYRL